MGANSTLRTQPHRLGILWLGNLRLFMTFQLQERFRHLGFRVKGSSIDVLMQCLIHIAPKHGMQACDHVVFDMRTDVPQNPVSLNPRHYSLES